MKHTTKQKIRIAIALMAVLSPLVFQLSRVYGIEVDEELWNDLMIGISDLLEE